MQTRCQISEVRGLIDNLQSTICNLQFKCLTIIVALVTLAACQPANGASTTSGVWTGFLEGKTLDVSPEVGGRVTSILVEEGEVVTAGQILATIDDEFLRLRIEIADANVAAAQAQLALLEAGARPEEMRQAEARVEQARAALLAATQALSDTLAIRAHPQTLVIAKADAEARAIAATFNYTATAKQAEAADLESRLWADIVKQLGEGIEVRLPTGTVLRFDTPQQRLIYAHSEWNRASTAAWQAWANLDVARANAHASYAHWKDLSDQLANPIALETRVNQARAARERAAANLQLAQAALDALHEGTTPAQLDAARAALDQARAARATLDKELKRYHIVAPREGIVTRIAYRVGEVIPPATALVRLSVAGELRLRVFVPMPQLERIHLGDTVTVSITELNHRLVKGTVTHIAERAEFVGRQAQTDQDRNAQLVAVEITVPSTDEHIKPGMPASLVTGDMPPGGIRWPAQSGAATPLVASGTLETRATRVAAEVSARAVSVHARRGDVVKANDVLLELDDATIKNSLSEAQAAVRAAQARLAQVTEPPRPATIALAEAKLAQANADVEAARAALADAERMLANPQELRMQLHVWEGKVLAAQGEVKRAQATLTFITNQLESAQADQSNVGKTRYQMLLRQKEAAEAALAAAQATAQGNLRVLELYRALVAQPLELLAAKNAAAYQVQIAEAGKKIAQAELDIAKRAPQQQAIDLAQAHVRVAQAQLQMIEAQARRYTLTAPIAGTLTGTSVEPGETVRVGAPLFIIADPSELEMTVYVPIRYIGAIKLGQHVKLTVPSLPGKTFTAQVTFIAPEAEFKPANLYNVQERSEMVFAVRVTIPNSKGELKAGLPADVTFGE